MLHDSKRVSQSESSNSLEPLLFVIERTGGILSVSDSVLRLSILPEHKILGLHLREFLLQLNPGWEELLPGAVSGFFQTEYFLPWKEENNVGMGWTVHAVQVGQAKNSSISLSLVPGLAPEMTSKVPEMGISESLGKTLHELFLHAQQSESRFRRFLKLMPGISFIQNSDLSFSRKGTELKMLLGMSSFAQLDLQSWTDWIHPADATLFFNGIERCKTTHHPVSSKLRLILPDKKTIYLLDIRFPVLSLAGAISSYEVLWIDLTRQRTAERRIHESAWKDSLAEVSASLTHDFNNLLGGIVNLSEMMRDYIEEYSQEQAASNFDIICDSAKQAQHLVQQVVSLNRNKPGKVELFDLKSFVEQQFDLIRIVLPQRIRFKLALSDAVLPVRMDPVAISRSIVNFATNARDAIPRNGEVILSLNLVDLSTYPRDHIFSSLCPRQGSAAELVFSDNGSGISPDMINQIFCAYFSTKGEKSGTGLGLASLYRYAEENGFDFGVRSTLGEGSDMILLLPLDGYEEIAALNQPDTAAGVADAADAADAADIEALEETAATNSPIKQAYRPGFHDELNVAMFFSDVQYSIHMEASFEQDFGVQAHVVRSLNQALEWFESGICDNSVFVLGVGQYDEIPEALLKDLELSFGRTSRILILNQKADEEQLASERIKKHFDIVLTSTEIPDSDNRLILRALGHSALFASHSSS